MGADHFLHDLIQRKRRLDHLAGHELRVPCEAVVSHAPQQKRKAKLVQLCTRIKPRDIQRILPYRPLARGKQHRTIQPVLVAKVVTHRGNVHARAAADVPHGCSAKPLLGEHPRRRLDQPLTRFRSIDSFRCNCRARVPGGLAGCIACHFKQMFYTRV